MDGFDHSGPSRWDRSQIIVAREVRSRAARVGFLFHFRSLVFFALNKPIPRRNLTGIVGLVSLSEFLHVTCRNCFGWTQFCRIRIPLKLVAVFINDNFRLEPSLLDLFIGVLGETKKFEEMVAV